MILNAVPFLYGGLYGFTPVQKQSRDNLWKFMAVYSPITALEIINRGYDRLDKIPSHLRRPAWKSNPWVSGLVLGPMWTGWWLCIGSFMGRAATRTVGDV